MSSRARAKIAPRRLDRVDSLSNLAGSAIRSVDRIAKALVQPNLVERHELDEEHGREIVLGIDPEQRACGSVPEELAHNAVVLVGIGRWTHAHGEVDAEADLSLPREP